MIRVDLLQSFRNDGGPGNVTATISFKCHESDDMEDVWSKVFFMDRGERVEAKAEVSVRARCAIFTNFHCCPPSDPTPPEEKLFYHTWGVRPTKSGDEDIGSIEIRRNT